MTSDRVLTESKVPTHTRHCYGTCQFQVLLQLFMFRRQDITEPRPPTRLGLPRRRDKSALGLLCCRLPPLSYRNIAAWRRRMVLFNVLSLSDITTFFVQVSG